MHLSENTKSNRSLWQNKVRVLLANPRCKPELKETTSWTTVGQAKDIASSTNPLVKVLCRGRHWVWGPDIKLFILVGCSRSFFVCFLANRGSTVGFLLLQCSSGVVRHPRGLQVSVATRCFCRVLIFVSSQYLSVIYLFSVMIHWWVRKPSREPNNKLYVLSHSRSWGRGWVPVKPV